MTCWKRRRPRLRPSSCGSMPACSPEHARSYSGVRSGKGNKRSAPICVDQFSGIEPFNGLGQLTPDQMASFYDHRRPCYPCAAFICKGGGSGIRPAGPVTSRPTGAAAIRCITAVGTRRSQTLAGRTTGSEKRPGAAGTTGPGFDPQGIRHATGNLQGDGKNGRTRVAGKNLCSSPPNTAPGFAW